MTDLLHFILNQSGVKNYLGQTDPTRDLVGDVFPVYMSYPGAGDVFHPTATHPDLQKHTHTNTSVDFCVPILDQKCRVMPIIHNLLVLERN